MKIKRYHIYVTVIFFLIPILIAFHVARLFELLWLKIPMFFIAWILSTAAIVEMSWRITSWWNHRKRMKNGDS